MKDSKSVQKIIGSAILIVCVFVLGFISGRELRGKNILDSSVSVDSSMFWDVWDLMKSTYVDSDKVSDEDMMYGAIKGMVESYDDPATVFLTPEETEEFNASSEGKYFEGIGAELGYEDGQIIVVSPLEGSPAKEVGIRAGDYILAVDDKELTTKDSIYDVVSMIRGEAGTTVKLTVLHKNDLKPVEYTITRREITVESMTLEYLNNNSIAHLKVNRFTEATYLEWVSVWDENVDKIVESGVKKMILDLRGNPGGFFNAAVYAADEFLSGDYTISMQQDGKGKVDKYESEDGGKLLNIDVVVLVDTGSASASEILAGALQETERAIVIGEKTYGKGTAQNV
ncbi:MAG: S41 family peptidase, partial [Candidatus Dojkabacteria bacterium]|nr:S41 family peptidase [Candidatus Dojkabacteria bacterium]